MISGRRTARIVGTVIKVTAVLLIFSVFMAYYMGGSLATVFIVVIPLLGGGLLCIFMLGRYLKRFSNKPKKAESAESAPDAPKKKKSNLGNIAMVAMFIGLCTAYISSYIGGFANDTSNYLPLLTAGVAAAVMAVFTLLSKKLKWLENFDVALSMLIAMAAAVLAAYIF